MDSSENGKTKFLPDTVDRDQAKDTGTALVLICLLVWYFGRSEKILALAAGLLIVNMIVPQVYKSAAKLWLGFSNLLGVVITRIVLSVLFYFLVTPVAVLKRLTGYDPMQRKKWKKDNSSVFTVRNHTYQPGDIDKPY